MIKSPALILLLLLNLAVTPNLFAQIAVNDTGNLPDTSAMLDISSTNKGFLLPRMTTVQRDSIILPATGLAVFNITSISIEINTGSSVSPVWSPLSIQGVIDTSNIPNFYTKVQSLISSTAPITYLNGRVGITPATTSTDGYLNSTDWNTFNNKASVDNTWSTTGNAVSADQVIGTTTDFNFPFITNNIERMRLTGEDGFLGIGNTAPSEILDVNGNVKFSGALMPNGVAGTAGQLLKSSGPGNTPIWTAAVNQTITFTANGDLSGSTTGTNLINPTLIIGANKVTNTMLAGAIDASKLVGIDIAMVGTITNGTWNGATITAINGGTGFSSYAKGDVIYASAINVLSKLGIGTAGQVFTVTAGIPAWVTPNGVSNYAHGLFTPATGNTIALVKNQYNIINPAGPLATLTVNLPSTPVNNDVVYIKFIKAVTAVTYGNGTIVGGIASPAAGGLVILTYDNGTSSWY